MARTPYITCSSCKVSMHSYAYEFHEHNSRRKPSPEDSVSCNACRGTGLIQGGQAHFLGGRVLRCTRCGGHGLVRATPTPRPSPRGGVSILKPQANPPGLTPSERERLMETMEQVVTDAEKEAAEERVARLRERIAEQEHHAPGEYPTLAPGMNTEAVDRALADRDVRSGGIGRFFRRILLAGGLISIGAFAVLFITQTSLEGLVDSLRDFWSGSGIAIPGGGPGQSDTNGADSVAPPVVPSPTATATPTSTPAPAVAPTPTPMPVSPWVGFIINSETLGRDITDRLSEEERDCLRSSNSDGYYEYFQSEPIGVRVSMNPPVRDVTDLPELAECLSEESAQHLNLAIAIFHDPSLAPPTPTAIPAPAPTPGPSSAPAATATPRPTATPSPHLLYLDEKEYMLELINNARRANGLTPVELGDNIAAQLHVQSALKNCVSSHWGLDGLKPGMRYSLAGGYQSNGEVASGLGYCYSARDRVTPIGSVRQRILQAHQGLMGSPGHRTSILRETHRKVNIGLAWNRYNLYLVQHFEGSHVEYAQLPEISDGILQVKGSLTSDFRFTGDDPLWLQIYYDPPPHNLTRGQVSRTYCYDSGRQVAALRPPLSGGYYYPTHSFTQNLKFCPSPYDVPSTAQPARSGEEAHRIWANVKAESERLGSVPVTVPWVTASRLQTQGRSFEARASIQDVLRQHGSGVYSIIVWGDLAEHDESVVISQYSIFHQIDPPTTYDP